MKINDVSEQERDRMRDKLQPVTAKYSASLGDGLVKEFYSEIGKARSAVK